MPALGIARLYPDGPVDTTFMDTAYNQFAGVPTHYYNPNVEGPNFVFTMDLQTDGNVLIGGGFSRVGGGYARDVNAIVTIHANTIREAAHSCRPVSAL